MQPDEPRGLSPLAKLTILLEAQPNRVSRTTCMTVGIAIARLYPEWAKAIYDDCCSLPGGLREDGRFAINAAASEIVTKMPLP